MSEEINLNEFKDKTKLKKRYEKQLSRLQTKGIATACIEEAVQGAMTSLGTSNTTSLVVYGEPQSGKTEMMICLTAKLLDAGHRIVVHLMNDSVDLLGQNLKRFKASGLAPAPKNSSELIQSSENHSGQELVVFCKKNARDLEKLIAGLKDAGDLVVIDDEADYATPNSKINHGTKTKINELVGSLIGTTGCYIGVTATPARLDLNSTFDNDSEKWVNFPPHPTYTGQDVFFPLDKNVSYRLKLLTQSGGPEEATDALIRFLVTVAYLNSYKNGEEQKYTMLVHTSGKKQDHEVDRTTIEAAIQALINSNSEAFSTLVTRVYEAAKTLYPSADPDLLTTYVVEEASRTTMIVLNSERDRKAVGDNATDPQTPFTIIIGGNIVSRGVTFPNLLSMFFTRDVRNKLQQDTYIQRARMFGARGEYLEHFELTIPAQLYADWHKCFIFHRLALSTITNKLGSPVWIGDSRVSVAAEASINKAIVSLDRGEMSFGMFDYDVSLDKIVEEDPTGIDTLKKLSAKIGNDALPQFLIDYIATVSANGSGSLAIHSASSIAGYGASADQTAISRDKGLLGRNQLEAKKFPGAAHHVKIFYNATGKARVFYKYENSLQFIQKLKSS